MSRSGNRGTLVYPCRTYPRKLNHLQRSALRSEVSLLRIQLDESVAQKEKFHEQLIAAEKRADRLQSKSLQPVSAIAKEEPSESGSREPESSPAVSVHHSQAQHESP